MSDEGWKYVRHRRFKNRVKPRIEEPLNSKSSCLSPSSQKGQFPQISGNYPYTNNFSNYSKKKPIMSYGIILFTIVEKNGEKIPLYLVSQRRDTVEYVDFIRGHYNIHDEALIRKFFSLMSTEERDRMKNHSFDELWKDLWINRNHRIFVDCFDKAYEKFEQIKDRIPELLKEASSNVDEPSWGFPKGKKNAKESPINCALREFSEETRLNKDDIQLISNKPVIELYKGSNNKPYGTNYFIATTKTPLEIKRFKTEGGLRTSTVSEELGDVKWLSLEEAQNKLNAKRGKLLAYVDRFIRNKKFVS